MAQQTAVRKLIDYITERGFDLEYEMEMSFLDLEKEHMIDFANKVTTERLNESIYTPFNLEQYYNETYNK
jgi:hypothetical protein